MNNNYFRTLFWKQGFQKLNKELCTQPYQQMHIDFDSQTLFVKLYVNAYTKGHVSSESRNVWDRVRMTENNKMGDESL